MGGWRFCCGVLGVVFTSVTAFGQAPTVDTPNEAPTNSNSAAVGETNDAANDAAPATNPRPEQRVGADAVVNEDMTPEVDGAIPEAAAAMEEPPATPTTPEPVVSAGLEVLLRADRPGRLRFEPTLGEPQEFRAPGRATLDAVDYQVTWIPSGGRREILSAAWQPNGEALRVAHRGPSFTNLLGYWLLGNGLLVGVPVSVGVFAKRDDLGAAATFSIIGVNTLVAIAGAILMGVGDDEVIQLESN